MMSWKMEIRRGSFVRFKGDVGGVREGVSWCFGLALGTRLQVWVWEDRETGEGLRAVGLIWFSGSHCLCYSRLHLLKLGGCIQRQVRGGNLVRDGL